jgi:hypothetical protein
MGPKLLNYVPSGRPITDVSFSFTPALGVRIAAKDHAHIEGTGALCLHESSKSDRVFLLTARHVALLQHKNELYECKAKSTPRKSIIILDTQASENAFQEMMTEIGNQLLIIKNYEMELEALGEAREDEDTEIANDRLNYNSELTKAKKIVQEVSKFHTEMTKSWSLPILRLLGHVIYAPPILISTRTKPFTEDWLLIEVDREKINWDAFKGNVVSLGLFRSI